jgi:outer membrane lipoprotein-sorting protein
MPKNRLIPAIGVAALIPLAAWAQGPAPKAVSGGAGAAAASAKDEKPTPAQEQLEASIKTLAAIQSVEADLTQTVDMLDQKFTISGHYLKAPGHKVALKLTLSGLPDAKGQMYQVCDGTVLWDYQQVLDSETYRRLDITKVLDRLKAPELDEPIRQNVIAQFGFGGPEALLKGLGDVVKFDIKESGELDGKAVWVLTGEWRSREGLTAPNGQPWPPTVSLPAYVPSLVKLYLGKEDGWPYKVELVGRVPAMVMETRKKGQDGHLIGSKSSAQQKAEPTRIVLLYTNVKLNPAFTGDEFKYQPPREARVEDSTEAFVTTLDNVIRVRAQQKKDEAAKGDDPLLKEAISVPRADAPGSAAPPSIPTLPAEPAPAPASPR